MSKVLIISGHTDPKDSVVNNEILDRLSVTLPEAEIVRLADLYTHKPIDVAREQQRLVEADIVVFQFPLFWFSIPSLLQRWMEEVWLRGFSHGSTGTALKGKKLILSFTVGAPKKSTSTTMVMPSTNSCLPRCLQQVSPAWSSQA